MTRFILFFVFSAVIICAIAKSEGQMPPAMFGEKEGYCPPPLSRQVCWDTCQGDNECPGDVKCCATACGGRVCSRPVTPPKNPDIVKPGTCPEIPGGPWFCSSMCNVDGDCWGKKKCCKNRCGAKGCYFPIPDQ